MIEELSPRQRQVLLLRANGRSCIQIAQMLRITPQTIYEILGRVYAKYNARDIAQAVAVALSLGDIGIHEIDVPGERAA